MDIYRDAKRRGIYLPLFTDPEGHSCTTTTNNKDFILTIEKKAFVARS